jgi:hypothetical protein
VVGSNLTLILLDIARERSVGEVAVTTRTVTTTVKA